MKRCIYGTASVQLTLLLAACTTLRQKVVREEQDHVQYAQMAAASDSLFRAWYVYADSGFRYHPDSGLHTLSGRLLGWEVRVNHRQEQSSSDSVGRVRSSETETQRNNTASGLWRFAFVAAVALIIGIFLVIRKMR